MKYNLILSTPLMWVSFAENVKNIEIKFLQLDMNHSGIIQNRILKYKLDWQNWKSIYQIENQLVEFSANRLV